MIERTDDDGIAVLTLTHGPVNAMDLELCEAVTAAFRELADDPARAVVLTGAGSSFSAGVDLRRIVDGGAGYVKQFLPALAESFRVPFELGKPVVAAVNGHAIAGGCVLAATADVVLMADGRGRIGLPELKVGVPFPRIALETMRFRAGEVGSRRLVVGAQTYLPADAAAHGIVDEVVDPSELVKRAVDTARALADEIPADTFAATKAALRREAVERADRYGDADEETERLWIQRAEDGRIAAFLESATRR